VLNTNAPLDAQSSENERQRIDEKSGMLMSRIILRGIVEVGGRYRDGRVFDRTAMMFSDRFLITSTIHKTSMGACQSRISLPEVF
jgi:hypothetical protein